MLTTAEARLRIVESIASFGTELIALNAAIGRILHQSVAAERDQPPFDRVTMDGIALAHAGLADANRCLPIAGRTLAGDPPRALDDAGSCIEIMTGAVLPPGADTVIPVERLRVDDGSATLEEGYTPTPGQFVHRQGSDHLRGTTLLSPGTRISATEIAVLASCGLDALEVAKQPKVRIISTGNELVAPGKPILPHQIRMSNGPALQGMLADHGFVDAQHHHIADDRTELAQKLSEHLSTADVLILSGGVSMGKADFVPEVLEHLGVERIFHKIRQRPGKPMWFGRARDGTAVFALPGNPVSAVVCCRQYVIPALFQASGGTPPTPASAVLEEAVSFAPKLTFFLPVVVKFDRQGSLRATGVSTNTSGDFSALAGTDGYVELDEGPDNFPSGTVVPYHPWDAR